MHVLEKGCFSPSAFNFHRTFNVLTSVLFDGGFESFRTT